MISTVGTAGFNHPFVVAHPFATVSSGVGFGIIGYGIGWSCHDTVLKVYEYVRHIKTVVVYILLSCSVLFYRNI